jgi:hypothetical protein
VLPPLLVLTKSGPEIASSVTAIHMEQIASDAHISRSCHDHP